MIRYYEYRVFRIWKFRFFYKVRVTKKVLVVVLTRGGLHFYRTNTALVSGKDADIIGPLSPDTIIDGAPFYMHDEEMWWERARIK